MRQCAYREKKGEISYPIRVKQTSDIKLVKIFSEVQGELKKNLDILASLTLMDDATAIKDECEKILVSTAGPRETVKSLLTQNAVCVSGIEQFAVTVRGHHTQLVGEINQEDCYDCSGCVVI
jgi:hypothetical protein